MKTILKYIPILFGLIVFAVPLHSSQSFVIQGTTYTFPDVGDENWGQNVTDWAGGVTNDLASISSNAVNIGISTTNLYNTIVSTRADIYSQIASTRTDLTNEINSTNTALTSVILSTWNASIHNQNTLQAGATVYVSSVTSAGDVTALGYLRGNGSQISNLPPGMSAGATYYAQLSSSPQNGFVMNVPSGTITNFTASTVVAVNVYGVLIPSTPTANSPIGSLRVNWDAVGNVNYYVLNSTPMQTNTVLHIGSGTIDNVQCSTVTFRDGTQLYTASSAQTTSTSSILYNLIITTKGTDTNTWVITADGVDVMGNYYTSVATTCQMNVTGAGGSASDSASTWYDLYFISNGSTVSIYANAYNTTLTLPSGYTKWRKVACVRNDGSSNLVPTYKSGNFVRRFGSANTYTNGSYSVTTPQEIDLSAVVSPYTSSVGVFVSMGGNGTYEHMVYVYAKGYARFNIANYSDYDDTVTGISWARNTTTRYDISYIREMPLYGVRTLIHYKSASDDTSYFQIAVMNYREDM